MKVEVRLIAFIQKYAPEDKSVFKMEVKKGATVTTVVEELGIPDTEPRLTLLNGIHAKDDAVLKDSDKLLLLTPIEGG